MRIVFLIDSTRILGVTLSVRLLFVLSELLYADLRQMGSALFVSWCLKGPLDGYSLSGLTSE